MHNRQVTGFPKPGSTVELAVGEGAGVTVVSGKTIRLVSTVDCFVEIGPDASADVGAGLFLPARVPEYFTRPEVWREYKVSAIAADGDGKLYITPMV